MTYYYGAMHNLEEIIATHLFIICQNDSGTTFLQKALGKSSKTWNLWREGQCAFAFKGPSTYGCKLGKKWASKEEWVEMFSDPEMYNWPLIKKAWYFQTHSKDLKATVFVEKSPQFLLLVEALKKNFQNAKFLFMVRNPYAVVEGSCRRLTERDKDANENDPNLRKRTAAHVINCLRFQMQNVKEFQNNGAFFTYEEMCDFPEKVEVKIKALVPELDDIELRQRIVVKDYDEMLRNMNKQQIDRLTAEDIFHINKVFSRHKDILDYFNYPLISV